MTAPFLIDARTVTLSLGGRWYGRYGLAFCPAHLNSRTPALSLVNGSNGRLLAKCHAGCDFREIVRELDRSGIVAGAIAGPDPVELARREVAMAAEIE